MAKRRSRGRRKSNAEARVERLTWGLLVLAIAITQVVPEGQLPLWFVPASGAVILLGSGMYQFTRNWRVSPITWIAAVLLVLFTGVNFYVSPEQNFLGASLLIFAGVIFFGVLTNET